MRITSENITVLEPNQIFVYGSNEDGLHVSGAAKIAYEKFGAKWGLGYGIHGQTYGIDTMSGLDAINIQVLAFLHHANNDPKNTYLVTAIGTGIAGHKVEQIALLFAKAKEIENIHLPNSFWEVINNT